MRGTSIRRIPAPLILYRMFLAINAAVMVSTTTAFCIMPASKASMPTFFMRAITMSRVSRSTPTTKTSVSIYSSNFSSCSGLMFWYASTTLVVSSKNCWILKLWILRGRFSRGLLFLFYFLTGQSVIIFRF